VVRGVSLAAKRTRHFRLAFLEALLLRELFLIGGYIYLDRRMFGSLQDGNLRLADTYLRLIIIVRRPQLAALDRQSRLAEVIVIGVV